MKNLNNCGVCHVGSGHPTHLILLIS